MSGNKPLRDHPDHQGERLTSFSQKGISEQADLRCEVMLEEYPNLAQVKEYFSEAEWNATVTSRYEHAADISKLNTLSFIQEITLPSGSTGVFLPFIDAGQLCISIVFGNSKRSFGGKYDLNALDAFPVPCLLRDEGCEYMYDVHTGSYQKHTDLRPFREKLGRSGFDEDESMTTYIEKKNRLGALRLGIRKTLGAWFGRGEPQSPVTSLVSPEEQDRLLEQIEGLDQTAYDQRVAELREQITRSTNPQDTVRLTRQLSLYLENPPSATENPRPLDVIAHNAQIGDVLLFNPGDSNAGFLAKLGDTLLDHSTGGRNASHVAMVTSTQPLTITHAVRPKVKQETLTAYLARSKALEMDVFHLQTGLTPTQQPIAQQHAQALVGTSYDGGSAFLEQMTGKKNGAQSLNCVEFVAEVLTQTADTFVPIKDSALPQKLLQHTHLFTPAYACTLHNHVDYESNMTV